MEMKCLLRESSPLGSDSCVFRKRMSEMSYRRNHHLCDQLDSENLSVQSPNRAQLVLGETKTLPWRRAACPPFEPHSSLNADCRSSALELADAFDDDDGFSEGAAGFADLLPSGSLSTGASGFGSVLKSTFF